MDNLEFLDGAEAPNAETQPVETQPAAEVQEATPAAEAQPEAKSEPTEKPAPARGPDGKFAKKDEPVMVPLQALHETRDEVKALKAQLEALKPQTQPQGQQVPDIFENPEGFAAHIQNQNAQGLIDVKLNLSEEMVRQSAGDDAVNAAQEWGKQMLSANPAFAQRFYSDRNPYGFLVKEYQRHTLMSQLGDDPKQIEAFLAWKQAQGQVQPGAQPNPQPTPAPTQSIASATSAGGVQHTAIGPGVAFGDFIK